MGVEIIGRKIASLRKKGCRQYDLAKAVGISTQAVSKWENSGVPEPENTEKAYFDGIDYPAFFKDLSDRDFASEIIRKLTDKNCYWAPPN